jgi:hypothetical protein
MPALRDLEYEVSKEIDGAFAKSGPGPDAELYEWNLENAVVTVDVIWMSTGAHVTATSKKDDVILSGSGYYKWSFETTLEYVASLAGTLLSRPNEVAY